jgi:hypothetical protein
MERYMKRHLKTFTLLFLSFLIPAFAGACNKRPAFLVAGKIENCQDLNKRDSYSPEFWIHNPEGSNRKIFVDGYELRVLTTAKYPQGPTAKCILGGEINPWGDGAVQVKLDSYRGPGLIEIENEDGDTISHQLSGDEETVLINLSPKHSVRWKIHSYSSYQFRGYGSGESRSETISGLGLVRVPTYSSSNVHKFGEVVPSSIRVRTRRGMPAPSTSRLGLSAELLNE